jgi:protein-tyrosine-phosphatase
MSRKRLLFVCVENSNRSQMAQAFATDLWKFEWLRSPLEEGD